MADDNKPNITIPTNINLITKSKGHTNLSKRGNNQGIQYIHGEIPVTVWELGIQLSGDKEYWRKDNYKNAKAWLAKNPYWAN